MGSKALPALPCPLATKPGLAVTFAILQPYTYCKKFCKYQLRTGKETAYKTFKALAHLFFASDHHFDANQRMVFSKLLQIIFKEAVFQR